MTKVLTSNNYEKGSVRNKLTIEINDEQCGFVVGKGTRHIHSQNTIL